MSASLSRDNWSLTLGWRYLDEMEIDDQIDFDEFTDTADAVNYFDFYGTYSWDNLEVLVGVENFTDEEPPYVPGYLDAIPARIYDFLGTFYSVRLKYSM